MSDVKYVKCKRCNRPLKTENAQNLGYGPICYQLVHNEQNNNHKDLFTLVDRKSDR